MTKPKELFWRVNCFMQKSYIYTSQKNAFLFNSMANEEEKTEFLDKNKIILFFEKENQVPSIMNNHIKWKNRHFYFRKPKDENHQKCRIILYRFADFMTE